jgi:glycosyltransferase involved in cell wall biosynthesis
MPEILLLCEYATLSGGERSMLATLGEVRRAGFSVAVIAPAEGPLAEELTRRDVELIPFSLTDAAGKRHPQGPLREALARLLRQRRPALLHANSLSMGRLSGPVADELRLPSISHLRDIIRLSPQATADVDRHTRLLAVSQATRAYHLAAGLTDAKLHVLHNGVDLQQFCPRPPTGYLHRELGLAPGAQLVGTIGQIGLRKGLDVLATAAISLGEQLPDVHYLIIGERWSEKQESREFEASLHAAAKRLDGRMHFLGVRRDVERILNELSLLVHPARQEPLGRVLLEASASGTPVLATDVGGTPEIFPPELNAARLIPVDDPECLARSIAELLADDAQRGHLAASARRRAEAAFSIEHAAAGLVKHYQELLDDS